MRALWLSLLCFAPFPLAVALTNLVVDAAHVASGDAYERGIAKLLLSGRGVTNIANPKDAAVVQYVIEGLPRGPEAIVLGSSRSRFIRARFFATRSFFNSCVSGGGLTDYLAIYAQYRARGFAPTLVVLEVSPWVFEPAYKSVWETRYASRRDLETALLKQRPLAAAPRMNANDYLVRLEEIISPGYFQTSVMTWLLRTRRSDLRASYFPFQAGDLPLQETQLPDGSMIFPERLIKDVDRQQIRAQAINYANPVTVPRTISPERVALFEAFVRRLERDGAHVVLYFPPYHPLTYERTVASKETQLPEGERTLRDLAARTGSETIGSYDPKVAGFTEDDFVDPIHANADAVARLFSGHWSSAAAADNTVRIVGIQNPNGFEERDGRPFFSIGAGASCFSLKASAAGWARISFHATPGPSLPETPRLRLLVTSTAAPQSHVVVVDTIGPVSVAVPIASGVTDACFTPLDHATVDRRASLDPRPLLLGVAAPGVEIAAAPAKPPAAAPASCRVTFARGWYAPEADSTNWHRWMSGPADLIITADAAGSAVLTGNADAMNRPDRVTVSVDNKAVGEFDIPAGDSVFHPFAPLTIPVKRGDSHVTLRPTNPAITQSTDPRSRAVAIQNLYVTPTGATVPCALEP